MTQEEIFSIIISFIFKTNFIYKLIIKQSLLFNRLLHAQAAHCSFNGAAETHNLALETIEKLKTAGCTDINHAALYAEFGVLFFNRSEYDEAYRYK